MPAHVRGGWWRLGADVKPRHQSVNLCATKLAQNTTPLKIIASKIELDEAGGRRESRGEWQKVLDTTSE
jgi:hypothetical protein